jgi:hypothetical protein
MIPEIRQLRNGVHPRTADSTLNLVYNFIQRPGRRPAASEAGWASPPTAFWLKAYAARPARPGFSDGLLGTLVTWHRWWLRRSTDPRACNLRRVALFVALKSIVRNFFSCVEVLVRECFWFYAAEWPLQVAVPTS